MSHIECWRLYPFGLSWFEYRLSSFDSLCSVNFSKSMILATTNTSKYMFLGEPTTLPKYENSFDSIDNILDFDRVTEASIYIASLKFGPLNFSANVSKGITPPSSQDSFFCKIHSLNDVCKQREWSELRTAGQSHSHGLNSRNRWYFSLLLCTL
jgi:hypothetical protein